MRRRTVTAVLTPRRLREGDEPDPRFTLANERTFLAWIRTALGLVAAAAGLEAFAADVLPSGVRAFIVAVLLLAAVVVAIGSLSRWMNIESAMRLGRALPLPAAAVLLSVVLVVVTLAFGLGLVL